MKQSRMEIYLRYLFIILSTYAAVQSGLKSDWVSVASAVLTILFLLLPPLLEKLLKIKLPLSFRWIYLGFIFASMYLGETLSFFYRIMFWDVILHTASAMMLANIAFLLLYVLNRNSKIDRLLSPLCAAIFVFSAPVALGAVWELFEYAADLIFGVNMIKAIAPGDASRFYNYKLGFLNSLHDLLMDAIGALIIALAVYMHMKSGGRKLRLMAYLKDSFIDSNPNLFADKT